jgi:uncharacterized protein (TIGR03000 family)
MYSLVMAMALSGTAALPAHGGHGGNGGCYGGYACSGYNGCSGYGHGCNGGGHRLFGGLFGKHRGHGCNGGYACSGYGSGYGCSGYGCNGGGHRLFGGLFGKHRGHGCNGGYACSGYGGGYGCSGAVVASCCGCTGGYAGGYGGGYGAVGVPMGAGAPVMGAPMGAPGATPNVAPAPAEKRPEEPRRAEPKPPAASNAPAKLLVSLPADAALTIDGQATTSTGTTREFASPVLEAGRDYVYTLKANIVRDGKTVEESQTIRVRAGQTSEVSFGLTAVAAN